MALKASIAPRNFGDTNAFARVADSSALTRLSRSCSASSKQRPPASQSGGCAPAGGGGPRAGVAAARAAKAREEAVARVARAARAAVARVARASSRLRPRSSPQRSRRRAPQAHAARPPVVRRGHEGQAWVPRASAPKKDGGCASREAAAKGTRGARGGTGGAGGAGGEPAESSGGGARHARGCKEREGLRRGATRRWAAAPRARAPPPSKRWRGEVSELSRRGLRTV